MSSSWMRSGDSAGPERADGDREEREVARDERDRHPVLPLERAELDARAPVSTSGANAMSGTVWLMTIHGSRPHSARRQPLHDAGRGRCRRRRRRASRAPRCRGSRARRGARRPPSGGCADGERVTGSPSRPSMSQTCGIARSLVRGSSADAAADHDAVGGRRAACTPPRSARPTRMPARPQHQRRELATAAAGTPRERRARHAPRPRHPYAAARARRSVMPSP